MNALMLYVKLRCKINKINSIKERTHSFNIIILFSFFELISPHIF